jgi:competence protein ComEC
VAIAVALGAYLERSFPLPSDVLIALMVAVFAAWLLAKSRSRSLLALLLLWSEAGLLTAAWHHVKLAWPADAIGHFATNDRLLIRLRGTVADEVIASQLQHPELYSIPSARSLFLIEATQLQVNNQWRKVTGLVRVLAEGPMNKLRIGDGLEIIGSLTALPIAVNPGSQDRRQKMLDQQVQATLHLKSTDAVTSFPEANSWSLDLFFAQARAWAREIYQAHLPSSQAGIAQALVCGEETALTPDQSEGYLQTGVYHVLAVSGQHLVVLCAFVGVLLRFIGGSMRWRALWLMAFVIFYMLLTGAQPPVVRSAVIVCAWGFALLLGRTSRQLNSLALAWIVIAIWQPSDLANAGCLLSFAAVWILIQVVSPCYRLAQQNKTPLDLLEEQLRSPSLRTAYWCWDKLRWAFIVSFIVWLGTVPLVASRFHLFSPVAFLIGPLIGFFIMFALVLGFLVIILAWLPPLCSALAWLMNICLASSDVIVQWGRAIPLGYAYCPDVPDWWVHGFYVMLIAVTLIPEWWRWWKRLAGFVAVWFALALLVCQPQVPDGLRLTTLAVGHGTAVVIEPPDGRCLLYDAGSLAGPVVAQNHISRYLWSRGRTKIDEVFLSHADLDHFNALPDLVERFRIGELRLTPTFAQKPIAGTRVTMRQLERRGVKTQVTTAGQQLQAGSVLIEVLHPPIEGPSGVENVRSMVLRITYRGHSILLTGDLEKDGMNMVLSHPIDPVDVLIAPHHGSGASNTERFATWCKPSLVISSETYPRNRKPDPYTPLGATLWRTWIHGGVTVDMNAQGIEASTFVTKQRWTKPAKAVGK